MAKSKSPIKLLEEGITSLDWELIAQAYEALSGESIEIPSSNDDSAILQRIRNILNKESSQVEIAKEKPKRKVSKKIEKERSAKRSSQNDDDIELDIEDHTVRTKGSGPVNKDKHKPIFPCEGTYDPKLAKICQDNINPNRSFPTREEYEPELGECTQCGTEFDLRKSYPMGSTSFRAKGDSEPEIILCEKCQNNPR